MKHPTPEEWMSFLYAEAPEAERRRLEAHLESCSECRRSVAEWRGGIASLESWSLPASRAPRRLTAPVIKWGLAACLVLGFGLFAGTLRAHQQAVADLREQAARQAQKSEAEINALRGSMADLIHAAQAEALAELKGQAQQASEKVAAAAAAETERLLARFAQAVKADRAADQREFAALLTELESRRAEEMRQLRSELETVAILTEATFQRAQNQLVRLAAAQQAQSQQTEQP